MAQLDDEAPLSRTPVAVDISASGADSYESPDLRHSSSAASLDPSDQILRRRSSAFIEVGLSGTDAIIDEKLRRVDSRPRLQVRFRSTLDVLGAEATEYTPDEDVVNAAQLESPFASNTIIEHFSMPNFILLALFLAIAIPSFYESPFLQASISPIGAKAGPIRTAPADSIKTLPENVVKRGDSPTVQCTRWSQQTALVNNTLYIYGGRASQQAGQETNTWNNDFLTLSLSQSWQISSPTLQGLPQPSGPPAVANGYLWQSQDTLYLYGGEFSDSPAESPTPFSMWAYDIPSASWSQQSNPESSPGDASDGGNQPIQRAAEGAGITVPNIGRGYYFGGHLDGYTTAGWSQSIARVYLTSLLEFTVPGYSNPSITGTQTAGSSGLYRNITQGGLQGTASFPERADGLLIYIPGFGKDGILLGLAGGTNATFTQMNIIDVYDIANSTWYKQSTSGPTPEIRVNPCAVVQSAPDGSSIQVYMYGGQNLIPYGNQTQFDDMWILTIPSFTWIQVDTSNQSVPPARAGHTCDAWNSQMVVVGGYVGSQLSCDSPGIYVFNTSSLTWVGQYVAYEGGNELNQQKSQENDTSAVRGSYGYVVPNVVQSVVGGSALGGATVTAPAQSALQGPLATGTPITYTVTQSNGATVTETSSPNSGSGSGGSGGTGGSGTSESNKSSSGTNVGAIVAGVLAGLLAVLAGYLGFCAWVYRRQLRLYKNHVAMAQRAHLGAPAVIGAGIPAPGAKNSGNSSSPQKFSFDTRSGTSGEAGSGSGTSSARRTYQQLASNNPYNPIVNPGGGSSRNSSTEDLMSGQEPSFLGVFLNPRRSLRVVNRD